jgi:hypothetical protein
MAETATTPKPSAPPAEPLEKDDALATVAEDERESLAPPEEKPAAPPQSPLQIGLQIALGFAGLSLLVGFFLPWLNVDGTGEEAGTTLARTGLSLALEGDLVGTPSWMLLMIPVLGASLAATAFMRLKFAGQVAIGIAVALLAYALYVLLQMFVQHTGLGLWVVAAGTFIVLLLGVGVWHTGRDKRKDDHPKTKK